MKMKEEKKGYRLPIESEKRDDLLRDALKMISGTTKYYTSKGDVFCFGRLKFWMF